MNKYTNDFINLFIILFLLFLFEFGIYKLLKTWRQKRQKIDLAAGRLMPSWQRPKKRYPITLTTNFVEAVRNVKRQYIIDEDDIKEMEDGEPLCMYLYEHMKVKLVEDGKIYNVKVSADGLDAWEDIGYIIRTEEIDKEMENCIETYVEIEGGKVLIKHGRKKETDFEPFRYNFVIVKR